MSLERQRASILIHSDLLRHLLAVVQDDLQTRRRKHFFFLVFFFLNNPAASVTFRFRSPWKTVKRKKGVKTLAPVRWFPLQPVIACVTIPNPVFLARRPLSSKLMAFTPEVKVSPRSPSAPPNLNTLTYKEPSGENAFLSRFSPKAPFSLRTRSPGRPKLPGFSSF